jgi:hypothetical protein
MEILAYIQSHWVEWLFAVLYTGLVLLTAKVKVHWKELKALKDGVVALLYDRLYQGCKYHIHNEEITESELKNMEHLYKAYHALGGNGTGTELYDRVKKLPLKED